MIPIAFDENFNLAIVHGVIRRNPAIDLVRAQDAGMSGAKDPDILEWAAQGGRVLVTHDVATLTFHAYERVRQNLSMPGVFEVRQSVPIAAAIDDIVLLCTCSTSGEWEGQVLYCPLR